MNKCPCAMRVSEVNITLRAGRNMRILRSFGWTGNLEITKRLDTNTTQRKEIKHYSQILKIHS